MQRFDQLDNRRQFLRFMAASPLLVHGAPGWLQLELGDDGEAITDPKDALDVFDFREVAEKVLPPAYYGYLATGVDDDGTLRANRKGFKKFQLRVRRLIDVSRIDMSVELLGTRWETPIILAPTSSQKAFHPDGELAVARAARTKKHLQVFSTVATSSVEDVTEATGAPVWYQLYPTNDWSIARRLLKRAEAAGCPVVALTIDGQGDGNRETAQRFAKRDGRNCETCHDWSSWVGLVKRKPMFDDIDVSGVVDEIPPDMDWDYIKRLKDTTTMKLFLKGIVTREDAELSVENGVDGIIVSNHGGRNEASDRSTIECLPEIVEAVSGRIPVIIDGGFRRGTDIFKAMALGANAVAIGRPYLWGLSAFGQEGVEAVLEILRRELERIMRQAGTTSVAKISRAHIVDSR